MKFIIEDVAQFKATITVACSLASKRVVSTVEQCVVLQASSSLFIKAIETGSHLALFNLEAQIEEEGEVVIQAAKLKAMTTRLNPKTSIIVSSEKGCLKYETLPNGTISEFLYHDQNGFNIPPIGEGNTTKLIAEENDLLPFLLPIITSSSFDNRPILFKSTIEYFQFFSQFSQTGYIRYHTPTISNATNSCQIYLKPSLLRVVSDLNRKANKNDTNKGLDIFYSSTSNVLTFKGELGQLSIVGDNIVTNHFNSTEYGLSLPVSTECQVNFADFISAVSWQGYNAKEKENITLSVVDGHLIISCSSNNKPASIVCESIQDFEPIVVNLAPLEKAIKHLGTTPKSNFTALPITILSLQQRIITFNEDNKVKILTLSSAEEPDTFAQALLYESKLTSH